MKKIWLSGKRGEGKYTLVDDDIFEKYGELKWHLSDTGYAIRRNNGITTRLHRLITNCPKNLVTDHINRNKLDNRRENLRCVTQSENVLNRSVVENAKGYYHSNSKKSNINKWVVDIRGVANIFKTEEEAKKAVQQIKEGSFVKRKDIVHEFCQRCGDRKQFYGGAWLCRRCALQRMKRYYQRKKERGCLDRKKVKKGAKKVRKNGEKQC